MPKGSRDDQYGRRAYVKVNGIQREKRFRFGTSNETIANWRDEARLALRKLKGQPAAQGSLEADIARYLLQVAAMPTFAQRTEHLEMWAAALGRATPRSRIGAEQIRPVLQGWRAGGLSAATCNKRRSALMHLWSRLDGKGAANPVRTVEKFRVDDAMPRGRDPHELDDLFKAAPACRSRACARVMLWTGMRPEELTRAQPDDVDLAERALIIRTAKGGRTRVVPLTSQAVSAWREFEDADCWQKVPQAAPLGRWVKDHTGIEGLRPYDLRHSYGTALARRQTRLDVIGALMGHSTLELTKRYTLAAVSPDALAATARLGLKARKAGTRRIGPAGSLRSAQ